MSADEIEFVVRAGQDEKEEQLQKQAWLLYNHAALSSVAVNDPKKFPTLQNAFPSLFKQTETSKQDWRLMKERMEEYAKAKRANYA